MTHEYSFIYNVILYAYYRHVAVWDIQSCSLKREISLAEPVEQFRLSESETHAAVVTSSGKLLLYTIEHADDLPAEPVLRLQLKVRPSRAG